MSKNNRSKIAYICPECSLTTNEEGICPECWIKTRKRIGLVDKRIQLQNKLNSFGNSKDPWSCPSCKSNSIALQPDKGHKHFFNEYREYEQLIRCANCGLQFVFKYKLAGIEVHSYRPSGVEE